MITIELIPTLDMDVPYGEIPIEPIQEKCEEKKFISQGGRVESSLEFYEVSNKVRGLDHVYLSRI